MEEHEGGNCNGEASETIDCQDTVCSGTMFDFSNVIFNLMIYLIRKILRNVMHCTNFILETTSITNMITSTDPYSTKSLTFTDDDGITNKLLTSPASTATSTVFHSEESGATSKMITSRDASDSSKGSGTELIITL